ncbi:MAG TPA: hypothetical protein VEF04_14200 [Blastocatellia bacterium]|nr:hypothetical protein [Blastocatellia bacterium]
MQYTQSIRQFVPAQSIPEITLRHPRLLIITDSRERLNDLRTILNIKGIEVTGTTDWDEFNRAKNVSHDVVVIDVGPEKLPQVLQELRERSANSNASILVEVGSITGASHLAGVLPRYRAMPCGIAELRSLTRNRLFKMQTRQAKSVL